MGFDLLKSMLFAVAAGLGFGKFFELVEIITALMDFRLGFSISLLYSLICFLRSWRRFHIL